MQHQHIACPTRVYRLPQHLLFISLLYTLSACGGGGSSGNDFIGGGNRAPTISGTPPATVAVDDTYSFQPTANDADNDALTFTISGLPPWTTFDTNNGTLEGTPATSDIGTYTDIEISVSDGNATTQLPVFSITVTATAPQNFALRFYGNGVAAPDLDRVKILIDDPQNNDPGPPADIGATDLTIEFWMMATASENTAPSIICGANNNWINGNIIVDRDRFNQGRNYGISIVDGRIAWGVFSQASHTLCGSTNVLTGSWHHIAVQRRVSDGMLWIYVDGSLDASIDGPDGDISYPDDGVPGNFCNGPCTNSDPFIVLGAEKHDAGAAFPSYSGMLDELRLSTTLRYSTSFTVPQGRFISDASTAALYHFDSGSGTNVLDDTPGNLSPGVLRFGGNPAGPEWQPSTAPTD